MQPKFKAKFFLILLIPVLQFSCGKAEYPAPTVTNKIILGKPVVTDSTVSSITAKYTINALDRSTFHVHGLRYDTDINMGSFDTVAKHSSDTGTITITIKNLQPNTQYYISPFVIYSTNLRLDGEIIPVKTLPSK